MENRIAQAEATLGCLLPIDYREFLLNPANADHEITQYFCNLDEVIEWTQDFPFTADQPVRQEPEPMQNFQGEMGPEGVDKLYDALVTYTTEHYEKPAHHGVVLLDGSVLGPHTVLVLRGRAHGEVWNCEIDYEWVTIEPRLHPITHQPLDFAHWLKLQQDPYRLTALPKKQVTELSYPKTSAEGKTAMRYHLHRGELKGIGEAEIAVLKKIADIPETAQFLDPYTGTWQPLREGYPVAWS